MKTSFFSFSMSYEFGYVAACVLGFVVMILPFWVHYVSL